MSINDLTSLLLGQTKQVLLQHGSLFNSQLNVIPIPYFGRIETAKVVTIGLNPSDGELKIGRWPTSLTASQIHERLTVYFENPEITPHSWFSTWEQALSSIGASYYDGSAAHLDLCPWPARTPKSYEDPQPFIDLIDQYLPEFSKCLELAKDVKIFILAGTVTKKFYMPKYLKRNLHRVSFGFDGDPQGSGEGHFTMHRIKTFRGNIPAAFCSVSLAQGQISICRLKGFLKTQISCRLILLNFVIASNKTH